MNKNIPPKLKDPSKFIVPYYIREFKFPHALCDLGSSINMTSLEIAKVLMLGDPKPTDMTLALVDLSFTHPYGILEYVLVCVDDLVFHSNFVVVGMKGDTEKSLIHGRPFLETSRALIDVESGELMLQFNDDHVIFNVCK